VTKASTSFLQKNMHKGPQALEKGLSQELITQIKGFHFNVAGLPVVSFGFDICVYAFFFFFLHCLSYCSLILKKGKYFSMYSFSILKVFSCIFG